MLDLKKLRNRAHKLLSSRSRSRGMTLIEIMVVVAILGLIATVVAVSVAGSWASSQVDKAKMDIKGFESGVDLFRLKMGHYPTTAEGLAVLYSQGILKGSLQKDPWGKDYVYVSPGQKDPKGYDIVSYGPDGNSGGGDDISNSETQ